MVLREIHFHDADSQRAEDQPGVKPSDAVHAHATIPIHARGPDEPPSKRLQERRLKHVWLRLIVPLVLTFIFLGGSLALFTVAGYYIPSWHGQVVYISTVIPVMALAGTYIQYITVFHPLMETNVALERVVRALDQHEASVRALPRHFSAESLGESHLTSSHQEGVQHTFQTLDGMSVSAELQWIETQLKRVNDRSVSSLAHPDLRLQQYGLSMFVDSLLRLHIAVLRRWQNGTEGGRKTASLASRSPPHENLCVPFASVPGGGDGSKNGQDDRCDSVKPPQSWCDVSLPQFEPLTTGLEARAVYPSPSLQACNGEASQTSPAKMEVGSRHPSEAAPPLIHNVDPTRVSSATPVVGGQPVDITEEFPLPSFPVQGPSVMSQRPGRWRKMDQSTCSSASFKAATVPPRSVSITIHRGGRFPTDNVDSFFVVGVSSASGSSESVSRHLVVFDAHTCPRGEGMERSEWTPRFVPHDEPPYFPFSVYRVDAVGSTRTELPLHEQLAVGFYSCELEDDGSGHPMAMSGRVSASNSTPSAGGPVRIDQPDGCDSEGKQDGSPLLPTATISESYVLSWSVLPKKPIRLTFLRVDVVEGCGAEADMWMAVDTSQPDASKSNAPDRSSPPPSPVSAPGKPQSLPVLECLIEEKYCVLTSAQVTLDRVSGKPTSVELHGLSIEEATNESLGSTYSGSSNSDDYPRSSRVSRRGGGDTLGKYVREVIILH